MTRLEELLLKFQDGSAAPEELRELEALLQKPEARAALVDEFFMTSAIREQLRAQPRMSRRFVRRPFASPPSWAWAAAALLAVAFLALMFSSSRETPKPVVKRAPPPAPVVDTPPPPKAEVAKETVPFAPPPPPPPAPPEPPVTKESVPFVPPPPPPAPAPAPVPTPEPVPAPEPPRRSQVVAIARVEKAEGTAFVVGPEGKTPAVAGSDLAAGQGLETGAGRVVFVFADKTRVELDPDTAVGDIKFDRVSVGSGTIRADVLPRSKDKPLIFATPHAEAKVLGTSLRVVVDKKGTLLEVEKGRVELRRMSDRKSVIVASGQFATSVELKAKPLSPNVPMVRFTFDDGKASPEWIGTPARLGNAACLEGRNVPEDRLTRVFLCDDVNGLFYHREGAVLTFDYWADGETQILSIYAWNRTQTLSMGQFEIRDLKRRQWTRATIPLSELRVGDKRPAEGDCFKNLTIQTNVGNGILFVDNVEIAVPRSK